MFTSHAGCQAVHFLRLDDRHEAVLTRWRDADAVVELHLSASYRYAEAAIDAAAVIEAASGVSLFPVAGDLFDFVRRVSTRVQRVIARLQVVGGDPGTCASSTPASQVDAVLLSRSLQHPRAAREILGLRADQRARTVDIPVLDQRPMGESSTSSNQAKRVMRLASAAEWRFLARGKHEVREANVGGQRAAPGAGADWGVMR